ncbi:UNVERIFIED_CONTAM: hypothetical protein HDU68_010424 [Siphonaria sp. JEL0065]|nr:hypothetical protein HDU68_010424 [Siphonaria sp. JEL0065]
MDSGGDFAVQLINNDPSILPTTMVNILRLQGWNNQATPHNGIGGIAPGVLEVASNYQNVIGAIGDTSSLSSMVSTGIFSQYKIPMCGGSQNLPALSNKENFPYYFRTTFANKWGNDIVQVLNLWKVTRVAMVYDMDDPESSQACLDIKQALFRDGIIVLTYVKYHGDHDPDFSNVLTEFKLVDARYIILCAQGWSSSFDLVEAANTAGFISPKHVWFTTQPPYPSDYSGSGDEPRLDKLIGMIYPAPKALPKDEPNLVSLTAKWNASYTQDPLKYQINSFSWTNAGNFDCVGTMLYGFDKLLKSNSSYTPAMLGKRQLQDLLTYQAFSDTGFKGTLLNPIRLDATGDIAANTAFISFSKQFWIEGTQPSFAEIDRLTGKYTALQPPVFYGGSSIPPPDGPPIIVYTRYSNDLTSSNGKIILSLVVIGFLVSLFKIGFFIKFREVKAVKMASVPECLIILTGSLLVFISLLFYIQIETTQSNCYSRIWLLLIGYVMMVAPVITKNIRLYIILNSKTRLDGQFLTRMNRIGIASVIFLEAAFLAYWTVSSVTGPTALIIDGYTFSECNSIDKQGKFTIQLITAFTCIVHFSLIILAYMLKDADPQFNESSALMTIFALVGILSAVIKIIPTNPNKNQDLIQCVCIWLAAVITSMTLFSGKVYTVLFEQMQEKGILKMSVKSSSDAKSTNSIASALKTARNPASVKSLPPPARTADQQAASGYDGKK